MILSVAIFAQGFGFSYLSRVLRLCLKWHQQSGHTHKQARARSGACTLSASCAKTLSGSRCQGKALLSIPRHCRQVVEAPGDPPFEAASEAVYPAWLGRVFHRYGRLSVQAHIVEAFRV